MTERKLFIGGFEFKQYTRKNVTYSADNNNIEEIATTATLGRGGFSTGKIYFVNNDEGISQSENALIYAYEGEQVTGMHATGLVLDLGLLKVSDYKTIKLLFQADVGGAGCGTNVICDSTEVASLYGGAHIVDLKALAEGKKLTSFSKLELSASSWGKLTSHKIYVGFIELELADGIEEDVEAPAEPEVPEIPDVPEEPEIPDVPAGPQSVTYSIANNNLWDIVTPLNNGTLSEVGWQGIVSLQYNYNSDEDIIAQHVAGIVLDLGKIKVSDYSSITLKYQTSGISEGGANIWLDGKNCASKYGGVQTIDLIAIANENGVTEFSTLELSFQGWNNAVIVKNYTLNFGYLELIVAE